MTIREIGFWLHAKSAKYPPLSWLIHGIAAIPFVLLVKWQPWTAPGAAFAYREGEQMWFRYLTRQPMLWFDHAMDVLAPGYVGWLFLR